MAEQEKVAESEVVAGEMRSKLITRLAVAGVLVALLLGVLAFFDYLSTAPDDSDEQVFTKPVPVAPKKAVSQPVTPADNLPAPPTPTVPEKTEAPVEPPPPPKIEANAPSVVEAKPEAVLDNRQKIPSAVANQKIPAARSPAPVAPASQADSEAAAPSSAQSVPRAAAPAEVAAAKPSVRILEAKPAPTVTAPVVSRLFSGFLLQAGVFSSVQRAEELHARLTLSGVPSSLETRVQVGPFKTKQEAEAAQAKLKELGVETLLVPPRGKN